MSYKNDVKPNIKLVNVPLFWDGIMPQKLNRKLKKII